MEKAAPAEWYWTDIKYLTKKRKATFYKVAFHLPNHNKTNINLTVPSVYSPQLNPIDVSTNPTQKPNNQHKNPILFLRRKTGNRLNILLSIEQ